MRLQLLATTFASAVAVAVLSSLQPMPVAAAAALSNDSRTIVHVLNRLGFGTRAGDIEKVQAMGVQAYIDQQLYPERLPDAAMPSRLEGYSTLAMSSREIAEQYALPAIEARRRQQQKMPRPSRLPPSRPPSPSRRKMRSRHLSSSQRRLPSPRQRKLPRPRNPSPKRRSR